MAYLTPVLGHEIVVKIGDGATPTEVFTAPNLINTSRGVQLSTETVTDQITDLDDHGLPAQTHRRVASVDTKIDGSGKLHIGATYEWLDWISNGDVKNIEVISTKAGFRGFGPFVLTSFQITGERNQMSECQITLEQAGPIVWSEPTP